MPRRSPVMRLEARRLPASLIITMHCREGPRKWGWQQGGYRQPFGSAGVSTERCPLPATWKTTRINCVADREVSVSRHQGSPIEGSPETPWILTESTHWGWLKGGPELAPMMPRGASLPDNACIISQPRSTGPLTLLKQILRHLFASKLPIAIIVNFPPSILKRIARYPSLNTLGNVSIYRDYIDYSLQTSCVVQSFFGAFTTAIFRLTVLSNLSFFSVIHGRTVAVANFLGTELERKFTQQSAYW